MLQSVHHEDRQIDLHQVVGFFHLAMRILGVNISTHKDSSTQQVDISKAQLDPPMSSARKANYNCSPGPSFYLPKQFHHALRQFSLERVTWGCMPSVSDIARDVPCCLGCLAKHLSQLLQRPSTTWQDNKNRALCRHLRVAEDFNHHARVVFRR